MRPSYGLQLPPRVYGGSGSVRCLAEFVSSQQRVTIFSDRGVREAGHLEPILAVIRERGAQVFVLDDLSAEPTVEQAECVIGRYRESGSGLIVAVGGGSVLDVAKLASVLDTDTYSLRDLLDHPEQAEKQRPTVLIPTTAGTGAEATPNSIVTVTERRLKIGIVNSALMADAIILDPELTRSLPRSIAAATGIDALAHAIECYTSRKATPFSDLYALEALRLIFANLRTACDQPENTAAREAMLNASFYAGIAIANSGTTAVHALAYPLGGRYHIPHGVSNAMLLAQVMRFNCSHCMERLATVYDVAAPGGQTVLPDKEKADRLLEELEGLIRHLDIPTSAIGYGISIDHLDDLVEAGMQVQRLLVNNPREVTPDDARTIYRSILSPPTGSAPE